MALGKFYVLNQVLGGQYKISSAKINELAIDLLGKWDLNAALAGLLATSNNRLTSSWPFAKLELACAGQ